MHESYVHDGVAKSKMVVCTYLCKHIGINIYRNINDILHFGVLFAICLFWLVYIYICIYIYKQFVLNFRVRGELWTFISYMASF